VIHPPNGTRPGLPARIAAHARTYSQPSLPGRGGKRSAVAAACEPASTPARPWTPALRHPERGESPFLTTYCTRPTERVSNPRPFLTSPSRRRRPPVARGPSLPALVRSSSELPFGHFSGRRAESDARRGRLRACRSSADPLVSPISGAPLICMRNFRTLHDAIASDAEVTLRLCALDVLPLCCQTCRTERVQTLHLHGSFRGDS